MTDAEELFEQFVERLPETAREKYEKGREVHGDAGFDRTDDYALRRCEEEFYEVRQSIEQQRGVEDALKEIADMRNFALMHLANEIAENPDQWNQ